MDPPYHLLNCLVCSMSSNSWFISNPSLFTLWLTDMKASSGGPGMFLIWSSMYWRVKDSSMVPAKNLHTI